MEIWTPIRTILTGGCPLFFLGFFGALLGIASAVAGIGSAVATIKGVKKAEEAQKKAENRQRDAEHNYNQFLKDLFSKMEAEGLSDYNDEARAYAEQYIYPNYLNNPYDHNTEEEIETVINYIKTNVAKKDTKPEVNKVNSLAMQPIPFYPFTASEEKTNELKYIMPLLIGILAVLVLKSIK